MNGRRIFRWVTLVIFVGCVAAIAMNVASDNTDLLLRAEHLAREKAGCGKDCKMVGMRGDRGMIDQRMVYTMKTVGEVEVVCRRAFIVVGDFGCEATVTPPVR